MRITFAKSLLSLSLATLIATPVMAQQSPPSSTPPKAEPPKSDAQLPKPTDLTKKPQEPPKPDQPKPGDQKPTPDKQKQDQQKQDQTKKDPPADPKSPPDQSPKDPNQPNNNKPDVNINIQQNNQRVLNNIQFFNVTTLPERIRVERIYTIYELRDNSGTVTVEGMMGEKRKIFLNEEVFLVTNLKDAAAREYPVLLGKEATLEKLNLQKGDQLKIEGHDGVVNDKHMLVAFKVTRQGNTINVKLGPDGVIVHEVAKPISN